MSTGRDPAADYIDCIDVDDLAHFRRIGSPFAAIHEQRKRVA